MQLTAPQNQGSKQENRITTALLLFTVCPREEVRLKLVIANVKDCREEAAVFFNGWKSMFVQQDTIHIMYFPCSVLPGRQWLPCGAGLHSPTAPTCPPCAAIMSGVLPAPSAAFTCALWLSSSCRHSTWSAKAAACRGVLGEQHPHSWC